LLTEAQRQGDLERYARHLLHADPAGRYALVALVWEPGQHSPVHAHHTWCGYGVFEGRLRNESYAYRDDVAQALWVDAVDCSPGAACFTQAGLQGIHRLGNASATRAVSIHVYGVEAARVGCDVNRIVPVVGGVSS
jgi:predicted metal-dependent enzyme (double-stranded beta helix superfamily)